MGVWREDERGGTMGSTFPFVVGENESVASKSRDVRVGNVIVGVDGGTDGNTGDLDESAL
jgi:hypothetical protein